MSEKIEIKGLALLELWLLIIAIVLLGLYFEINTLNDKLDTGIKVVIAEPNEAKGE